MSLSKCGSIQMCWSTKSSNYKSHNSKHLEDNRLGKVLQVNFGYLYICQPCTISTCKKMGFKLFSVCSVMHWLLSMFWVVPNLLLQLRSICLSVSLSIHPSICPFIPFVTHHNSEGLWVNSHENKSSVKYIVTKIIK